MSNVPTPQQLCDHVMSLNPVEFSIFWGCELIISLSLYFYEHNNRLLWSSSLHCGSPLVRTLLSENSYQHKVTPNLRSNLWPDRRLTAAVHRHLVTFQCSLLTWNTHLRPLVGSWDAEYSTFPTAMIFYV